MDFASKMEPKIEPEIDKIRALARLWAQMASKRATTPHFDQLMKHLAWFYNGFCAILHDCSTNFQSDIPKSSDNPACNLSNCDLWEGPAAGGLGPLDKCTCMWWWRCAFSILHGRILTSHFQSTYGPYTARSGLWAVASCLLWAFPACLPTFRCCPNLRPICVAPKPNE